MDDVVCLTYTSSIALRKELFESTQTKIIWHSAIFGANRVLKATFRIAYEDKSPEDSFSLSTAPLTVQGAVRVVQNLGRKYLWVDKYCINQKEGPEKQMMLQNMDHIYENAELILII